MGQRRKFDKAFKEQVVLRILSEGSSISELAKELNVHHTTIRDWLKDYKQDGGQAFPGSGHLKAEDQEIRQLRNGRRKLVKSRFYCEQTK